jgi:GNAT superfamily N-acetyltransferase
VDVVSLAERPDLADAAFGIPYGPDAGVFMQGGLPALLLRRRRMTDRWADHVLALVADDGSVAARSVAVPFRADRRGREPFPDGGWDQVAVWAAEDALDGCAVDTLCALEIVVHPDRRGQQLSSRVLEAMRTRAAAAGLGLVAPVRPPDKAREPHVPMAEYAARTRADGLPSDRWLRVHVRAGGRVVGVCACSATVPARLAKWRSWTGLPFAEDGPTTVPGGLVPVLVSTDHGVGVYVEPNVWVDHSAV